MFKRLIDLLLIKITAVSLWLEKTFSHGFTRLRAFGATLSPARLRRLNPASLCLRLTPESSSPSVRSQSPRRYRYRRFTLANFRLTPFAFLSVFSLFSFAFATAFFIASLQHPDMPTNATISADAYSATITTSNPDLTIDVHPGSAVSYASGKQTVKVKTNATSGYRLYLSSTSANGNINKVESSTGSNAPSTSGGHISAANGSHSSPAPLSANSWGYAIARDSAYAVGASKFDSTYEAKANFDYAVSKWAGLPGISKPVLVQKTDRSNSDFQSLDVYYGVAADSSLASGKYRTNIRYTVIIDGTDIPNTSDHDGEAVLDKSHTEKLSGGDKITITTSLMNFRHLDSEQGLSFVSNDVLVTVGDVACTNVSIGGGRSLQFSCLTPSKPAGTYDVVATIPKLGKTYRIPAGLTYRTSNPYPSGFAITSVTPTSFLYQSDNVTPVRIFTDLESVSGYPIEMRHITAQIGGKTCSNLRDLSLDPVSFTCTPPAQSPGKYDVKVSIHGDVGKAATKPQAITYETDPNPTPDNPYPKFFNLVSITPSKLPAATNDPGIVTVKTDLNENPALPILDSYIKFNIDGETCRSLAIVFRQPIIFTCIAPRLETTGPKRVNYSIDSGEPYNTGIHAAGIIQNGIEYESPNPYSGGFTVKSIDPSSIPVGRTTPVKFTTDLVERSTHPISDSHISATIGSAACLNVRDVTRIPISFICDAPDRPLGPQSYSVKIDGPVNYTYDKVDGITYIPYDPYPKEWYLASARPDRVRENTTGRVTFTVYVREDPEYPILANQITAWIGDKDCTDVRREPHSGVDDVFKFSCTYPAQPMGNYNIAFRVDGPYGFEGGAHQGFKYDGIHPYLDQYDPWKGFDFAITPSYSTIEDGFQNITVKTKIIEKPEHPIDRDDLELKFRPNGSGDSGYDFNNCVAISKKPFDPDNPQVRFTCLLPRSRGDIYHSNGFYDFKLYLSAKGIGSLSSEREKLFEFRESDPDLTGIQFMQDMTPQICDRTPAEATATLRDRRDGKTYTVKKAKDNKCWMTKDLAYELNAKISLSSLDSDVSGLWQPEESTIFSSNADNAVWGEEYQNSAKSYRSYGVFYNWHAATAGSAPLSSASGGDGSILKTASHSVCPKGWRLPTTLADEGSNATGRYSGEYSDLNVAYGGEKLTIKEAHPMALKPGQDVNFSRGGAYDAVTGKIIERNQNSHYWGSTYGLNYAAPFVFNDNSYAFGYYGMNGDQLRRNGAYIRCVAR